MKTRTVIEGSGGDVSVHLARKSGLLSYIDTMKVSGGSDISFERRLVTDDAVFKDDASVLRGLRRNPQELSFSEGVRTFGLDDPKILKRMAKIGVVVDSSVVDALALHGTYEKSTYDFFAAPGERGEMRRQMMASYPFFAVDVSRKIRLKMATDRRESPLTAFSTAYGMKDDGTPLINKGLLKRFAARPISSGDVPVQSVVEAASRIPVDLFPSSDEEWSWFLCVVDGVYRKMCPELELDFAELVSSSKGKWGDFVRRCVKAADNIVPPEGLAEGENHAPTDEEIRASFLRACEESVAMVTNCRNTLVLPTAGQAADGRQPYVSFESAHDALVLASRMMLSNKTLVAIFELSRRFQPQAAHIETYIKVGDEVQEPQRGHVKVVSEDGWPPLCNAFTAPNGLEIVPLTDREELLDEGRGWGEANGNTLNPDGTRGMNLCVGHYYAAGCKSGKEHVLSVREPGGPGGFTRKSTIRYHIKGDFEGLAQQEHRGYGNGAPPADSVEAIAWFEESVREGLIPLNRDGVLQFVAGKRKIAEEIDAYSGYDWQEVDCVSRAREAWAPYLAASDLGREEIISRVDALVQKMAPAFGRYALA